MVVTEENKHGKRLRLLCLHGFRTSGDILKKQLGKWSSSIHDLLDLTFLDAPFPATGKSEVDGMFSPPFYEWYTWNKDYTVFKGLEESLTYVEDYFKEHGPFDGFFGFSQGAILSTYLTCLQHKGLALQDVDPISFLFVISGAKYKTPDKLVAYEGTIPCSSIHFLGEKDYLLTNGQNLIKSFPKPLVINHPSGHVIPRLDDEATLKIVEYLREAIDKKSKESVEEGRLLI